MVLVLDKDVKTSILLMEIFEKYGIILQVQQGNVYMLNHKGFLGKKIQLHDCLTTARFYEEWTSTKNNLLKKRVYDEIPNIIRKE